MKTWTRLSFAAVMSLAATAVAAPPSLKPGSYAVDPAHSFVLFKIQHFGAGYVYGQFKESEGKITVGADASKDALDLSIKTASVDTHNAKRDTHLASPDFFNAAQFPTITFKSTKVARNADGSLDVTGDLTIRGKTKSVTAKVNETGGAEDPMKKYRVGFEGHATVNRNDFDLSFMPGALGDSVELTIAVEGVAQ